MKVFVEKEGKKLNRGNSNAIQSIIQMASLYGVPPKAEHKFYRDYWTTFEDQLNALEESSTVYVGNLDFNTSEEKIYDLFSRCGVVEQIIMGINKFDRSPCGFCFVVYFFLFTNDV